METCLKHTVLFMALILCIRGQLNRQKILDATMKVRKLPNNICGESSETAFEKKIIHGDPAGLGSYPWMSAIGYTLNGIGPYWNCGGSLITDQYVITAAHCLDPARIKNYKVSVVRVGDLDLDDSVEDGASPQDVEVEKTVFHNKYDNVARVNDIGLVKLKRKVEFHDKLKPICLPTPDFLRNTFVSTNCIVAGWGRTSITNATPVTRLREAELEVVDLDACRKNITRVLPTSVLDERVICATAPGKDSCQGDSGGPLMVYRRYKYEARMYLLGLVSYGYRCAVQGYPGVYTKVDQHMSWIIENLEI